jgi:hypothetical protein
MVILLVAPMFTASDTLYHIIFAIISVNPSSVKLVQSLFKFCGFMPDGNNNESHSTEADGVSFSIQL